MLFNIYMIGLMQAHLESNIYLWPSQKAMCWGKLENFTWAIVLSNVFMLKGQHNLSVFWLFTSSLPCNLLSGIEGNGMNIHTPRCHNFVIVSG